MDFIVTDVGELPAHTYLSLRFGDLRRQAPFRKGQKFSFPVAPERACTIDIFRKVGSKQISLAGISALGGTITSDNLEIPSLEIAGSPVTVSVTASLAQGVVEDEKGSLKKEVAQRAKSYLDKHQVQPVLHDMFARLLERLPGDPLAFMIGFLEQQRQELEGQQAPERDFSQQPGMGDEALPGFSDLASVLPPLRSHHTLVADTLQEDEQIYPSLKDLRTDLGVSLAQCIKPGIDCPGHELVKVAGAYAGDEQCYELYGNVFNPIITVLHNGYLMSDMHAADTSPAKITNDQIDRTGRYAVFATLEVRRNLSGIRLPTCCSLEERREVERIITHALLSFDGELKGVYYPLRNSESYLPQIGGMTTHQEEQLRRSCILFTEPDSKLRLSAGFGRHWPDARGIYVNEAQSFYIWCNEEDHARFCARQHKVDIKSMWARIVNAVQHLEKDVIQEGYSFMHSKHLGYLTTCPSRLGTTLRISVSLKIPLLAASVDLSALCRSFQLNASQQVSNISHGSVWNISNVDSLGVSEVDVLNGVIEGCQTLVTMEQRLEKGEPIYNVIPGMGPEPCAGFAVEACPRRMPDLSAHCSLVAKVLMESPAIYESLRTKKTLKHGVSLAACIKPGIDERTASGEPFVGLVAGDEECFATYADVFDPILKTVHEGWSGNRSHPMDRNVAKLSNTKIDPSGLRAISVRVELRRNLSGLRLSTCCNEAERREVERIIVKSLIAMGESWAGSYMPLTWSNSYVPKPGGMLVEEQARLREDGLLFPEPVHPLRLSMGLGRNWPDARGMFLGSSRDFSVWVNEEDHICAILTNNSADLKEAFIRATDAINALENQVSKQGFNFMTDSRLGYLTVDPMNLGNGLKCIVSLCLPNLGQHRHFNASCRTFGLSANWRAGAWELASLPSLGVAEIDVVSTTIEGCAVLVSLEQKLGRGEDIDPDLIGFGILVV